MKKLKTEKKTPKNDIGYGDKKIVLNDMKKDNTMFDDLDEYFGGNPIDEVEKLIEDLSK
jgi:hypothetical protein